MKRIYQILPVIFFLSIACQAQEIDKVINVAEVERIERTLSSDDMQGRKVFSTGIEKAADFIEGEFRKAGLQTLRGSNTFRQPFVMLRPHFVSAKGNIDGRIIDEKDIVAFTTKPLLNIRASSGFEKVLIGAKDTFNATVRSLMNSKRNVLVLVDPFHEVAFNNLKRYIRETYPKENSVVFVLSKKSPAHFSIQVRYEFTQMKLTNVVGILPGKSKQQEYVIFSGHYDHLGIGAPNASGDSIYNGANDDAAGTTAVIMLANYFAQRKDNERTLIFAAFTAEEIGGFGSQYFSRQFNASDVKAMFNIEMIGTESKWGANSAYITGFEKSDMGTILQKNLKGSPFRFYPDPYPEQQLFYRSDNATLARLGVPAHTISTSKMDDEKYYHTQEDEIGTLDMNNMAAIIRAIAISSNSIIAGKDTPSRVNTAQLR